MNEKVKVSQDTLYKFLTEHGVIVTRIAELMGTTVANVNSNFLHHKQRDGVPRRFNAKTIPQLNKAIWKLAEEIHGSILHFDEQAKPNHRGNTYDKTLVEPIKDSVGYYFNITALCERVLGWKRYKKHSVLETTHSKIHGNITKEDANRINAELLAVAGVLSSYEVVADDDSSSSTI